MTTIIKEWRVTEEVKSHETSISMVKAALAELGAGTDMTLKVRLSCPRACDLRGKIVKIIAQDAAVLKEIELVSYDEAANETDEFVVKAPVKPGEYTWTAVFPAQEKEGILHGESSAPFSFSVKPHITSMAVWDVPSPIAFNARFKLKVGVKCSAECKLTGKEIEILNHQGEKVATGMLGEFPWPASGALYWAEVELEAPATEGYHNWTVQFPNPDLELPHGEASYPLVFGVVRPPEHLVTVEVIDKDEKTPIMNAQVMLHPYRGFTDKHGMVKIGVTKGEYILCIPKHDKYKTFQKTVHVDSEVAFKAELAVAPVDAS